MESCGIFFVLQILTAMCERMTISSLSTTFQYDFTKLLNISEVIVWPILENSEKLQPQRYTRNIPKFETNRAYLILTRTHMKGFCVFYWTGRMATLVAKKAAAKFALQQYLILMAHFIPKLDFSVFREEEFLESRVFENTINFERETKKQVTNRFQHQYFEYRLLYTSPNLHIVRGTRHTARVKAVPIGTQWLIKDACLILETGYTVEGLNPVTRFCGPTASEKTLSMSAGIVGIMQGMYTMSTRPSPPPPSVGLGNSMFKILVEILENSDNYRSFEVDDSNDHLKDAETFIADRDRCISFHKIRQNAIRRIQPRLRECFSKFYRNVSHFVRSGIQGSYLLDSASVAGIFLQIHFDIDLEEKLTGLEVAEEYLHINYSAASKPMHMRIGVIYEYVSMPLNLIINLSNFPLIGATQEENGEVGNND